MFPLSSTLELSSAATLVLALMLGFGFGFSLERAGFGSARKLTAVFYFYDMSVVKVMFTAIVTAMAGLFLLSAAGLLEFSELYVEPTNYAGAIIGGLLFGTGFVVGGYCPGTSIAACATGRIDGFAFVAGMLGGVFLFAEFLPGVDEWARSTAQGEITLPGLTGISMGWFVLLFVVILVVASRGMRAAEKHFARLRPSR
jgi:uncharacterized membrane protein YedE/YeeE